MIRKLIVYPVVILGTGAVAGGLLFGDELFSYLRTSTREVRSAVKDAVPLEFELARAREMIDGIIPEMKTNITLIAEEEVEIENLRRDIKAGEKRLEDEQSKLAKLRDMLDSRNVRFTINDQDYSRSRVTEDLSRRFERVQEAEAVLEGKRRLLESRQQSLAGAKRMLDKTRHQKALLEDKVASLEAQYRLVKAAGTGTGLQLDDSKLAKAEKLIGEVRTRLDVAERVLAHEARFVETIPLEAEVDEADLVARIDRYLDGEPEVVEAGDSADAPAAPAPTESAESSTTEAESEEDAMARLPLDR